MAELRAELRDVLAYMGYGTAYDVENRLTSIPVAGYSYAYDPWGKPIFRVVSSTYWAYEFYGIEGRKLGTVTCTHRDPLEDPTCSMATNVYFGAG